MQLKQSWHVVHGKEFGTYDCCPLDFADTETSFGKRRGGWRNKVEGIDALVDIPRLRSNNYALKQPKNL